MEGGRELAREGEPGTRMSRGDISGWWSNEIHGSNSSKNAAFSVQHSFARWRHMITNITTTIIIYTHNIKSYRFFIDGSNFVRFGVMVELQVRSCNTGQGPSIIVRRQKIGHRKTN